MGDYLTLAILCTCMSRKVHDFSKNKGNKVLKLKYFTINVLANNKILFKLKTFSNDKIIKQEIKRYEEQRTRVLGEANIN